MKGFIAPLLILLMALGGSFTALAADEHSSCAEGESLCANVYQNNSLYIEAVSQLLPETSKELLRGDNIFKKTIEGVSRSFYVLSNSLTAALSDTKIRNTAIDVYFDKTDEYDTFLSFYEKKENPLLTTRLVEQTSILFLNMLGIGVIVLLLASIVWKVWKIVIQDKSFERVFSNLSMQSIMFIILPALLVSFSGDSFPPLQKFIVGTFIVGCFFASALVAMVSGPLLEIFSSDSVYNPLSIKDNAQFQKQTIELIDSTADEIAESVILIDLEFTNLVATTDGISKVSNTEFRRVFAEDEGLAISEKCVDGEYWHFNIITSQDCKSFREFLRFKAPIASSEFEGTWREKLRGFAMSRFTEGFFSDYFDTEDAVVAAMLDDLVIEVYRRVESRKTQICSSIVSRDLKFNGKKVPARWFCTKFDYKTGQWNESGEFYAEAMADLEKSGATELELSKLASQIQQESVVDDVLNYSKSLDAISTSISNKMALEDEIFRVDIDASNIAKAFFSITHELDNRYRYSSKITTEAFKHLNMIYSAVLEVSPVVSKNGSGLAETSDIDHREKSCKFFGLSCEVVDTQLDSAVEENNKYLNASSEKSIIEKLMGYVRQKEDVEQNIYSAITRFQTLIAPFAVSAKIAVNIYEAYRRKKLKDENPMMSDAELDQLSAAPKFLKFIIDTVLTIIVGLYVLGYMVFAYTVITKMLEMMYRLIIHVLFSPIAVLAFLWKVNDKKHDDENIFIPEQIKNIVIRTLVDPVSVTASFAIGLVMCIVMYKLSKLMIVAISGLYLDESAVFLPIVFALEVVLNAVLAALIMMSTAKTIQFSHTKITEFLDDQLGVQMTVGDEMDKLKSILLMGFK